MKIEEITQNLRHGGDPIVESYNGYRICAVPHGVPSANIFRGFLEGFENESGTANGYIEIPEFEEKHYEDIPSGEIHGGWTFNDGFLFGFDTYHYNSKPFMNEEWVLQQLRDYVDDVLKKGKVNEI